jgi:hypothetical protein
MIELLVFAVGLSCILPNFVGASYNLDSWDSFHCYLVKRSKFVPIPPNPLENAIIQMVSMCDRRKMPAKLAVRVGHPRNSAAWFGLRLRNGPRPRLTYRVPHRDATGRPPAPLTTNDAPGSVCKVAAMLRSGSKACAQAKRLRTCCVMISKSSNLTLSVAVRPLNLS